MRFLICNKCRLAARHEAGWFLKVSPHPSLPLILLDFLCALFPVHISCSSCRLISDSSSRLLRNKAKSRPQKQAAVSLPPRKLPHPSLSRNAVMLWQQSTVIFQVIGESGDSYVPSHVLYLAIQPLALLHADVSNPVSVGVLRKYWLSELTEYITSFSPHASLICIVPSEFLKTNRTIINLGFTRVLFKLI